MVSPDLLKWIRLKHRRVVVSLAILTLIVPITIAGCSSNKNINTSTNSFSGHLKYVKFRIIDNTGEPLRNRELNICRFVCFKLAIGAPSPYLNKKEDFYIRSVTTDDNGVFILDLSSIDVMDIVVEPGPPYNIVHFWRSSDLTGTQSADHIRVVMNAGNMIYDLKQKKVKIIPFTGESTERPYEEILLVTRNNEAGLK